MSYMALVTDNYNDVTDFYGNGLGFEVVEQWDRPNGRGKRFDLGGMRLEILDNQRKKHALTLGRADDRIQVVIEVQDIEAARQTLNIEAPPVETTSWGSKLFLLHDPDGIPVTYLEWTEQGKK